MTKRQKIRQRALIWLGGATLLLLALLLINSTSNARYYGSARSGQAVFPQLKSQLAQTKIIRIKIADTAYTVKRAAPESQDWVMIESGNYPVRGDRLSALAEGLSGLTWGEARTTDIAKFDRIGLGDPAEGGNGAYVEVLGQNDEILAAFITGRREDRLYARLPGEVETYRIIGALPPFYTREAWLDLSIIEMFPDVIGAVRMTDARGDSLYLSREAGSGPRAFRPAAPYENDRLVSRLATSGPALAISRFAPIDVKPAAALETRALARHITSTHDGLEVDVSAYREPDGFFVTLRAVEAGEGARRAEAINTKAEGWAFQLTEFDWNEFTPPIASLVVRGTPAK